MPWEVSFRELNSTNGNPVTFADRKRRIMKNPWETKGGIPAGIKDAGLQCAKQCKTQRLAPRRDFPGSKDLDRFWWVIGIGVVSPLEVGRNLSGGQKFGVSNVNFRPFLRGTVMRGTCFHDLQVPSDGSGGCPQVKSTLFIHACQYTANSVLLAPPPPKKKKKKTAKHPKRVPTSTVPAFCSKRLGLGSLITWRAQSPIRPVRPVRRLFRTWQPLVFKGQAETRHSFLGRGGRFFLLLFFGGEVAKTGNSRWAQPSPRRNLPKPKPSTNLASAGNISPPQGKNGI